MDCSYILYELSICTMLVLAKDAGMLFAVTIVVLFWVDTIKREKEQEKGISKNILIICAVFPISVFALKFLWGLNIKMNGANVLFSQPVDFKSLALVLLGRESSYRTEVWRNYCRQLISHKIPIGNTGIEINYITLFVMLVCLLYWLLHKQTGKRIEGIGNKTFIGTIVLLTAVYIIGLCITYMYKFTEYEAKQYASFQRYINILFLAVWILINMLVLELINGSPQKHKMTGMVFICIVAASIPLETIDSFVRRQEIVDSANSRSAYEEISEKIMRESGEEISKVYLISQESSGYDWFVIRYNVRPNYIDNLNGRWSIGKPFYEGDVWTREMTAEQWKEELKNNYDLVALYKVNEYFMQNFAVVFENPNEIEENEVYRVNKQTGLLEKCVD